MKQEDIEKAAGDYSGSALGFRDNKAIMEKHKAFVDGANWRINSVWHDASEKPKNGEMILVVNNMYSPFVCGPFNFSWKETVESFGLNKWAYINDLMPFSDAK